MRKRVGSEGPWDGFVGAIGELLPKGQLGRKGQCTSGKTGWTCMAVGRTYPSNADPFGGINTAPELWLGSWAGHQVVAAELWVGVGWTSCLDTPCGQVLRSCAWRSQH